MNIEIITPDRKVFTGTTDSIGFPGIDGSFEVLDHHASLITIGDGPLTLREKGRERHLEVEGGIIEVLKNGVSVLAERVTEK